MKYKVFLTESLEYLKNEELIGDAKTFNEACRLLKNELFERDIPTEPYMRFLAAPNATFIDFGSWSRFAAIVPPVPMSVLTGTMEES